MGRARKTPDERPEGAAEQAEPKAQEPEAGAGSQAAGPEAEPQAMRDDAESEAPVAAAERAPEEPSPQAPDAPGAEADATVAAETAASKPRRTRGERKERSVRRAVAKKARAATEASSRGRKPITRLPRPVRERSRPKERRGVVVSDVMDKTIVVRVETARPHPVYKKVVRRTKKLHAHDEHNSAKVGDVVRIVETRPLSKTKTWRLAEILEAAK